MAASVSFGRRTTRNQGVSCEVVPHCFAQSPRPLAVNHPYTVQPLLAGLVQERINEGHSLVNRQTVEIEFIGCCFHMATIGSRIMDLPQS